MVEVYLAARYKRYKEMQIVRDHLEHYGFKVVSRWINGDHDLPNGVSAQAEEKERIRFATEDTDDLIQAPVVVCFTEIPRKFRSRGGRHVELGMALALDKKIFVVGHRENVFCCLPRIVFCKDTDELYLKIIGAYPVSDNGIRSQE